ncbi:hypothetical protein EYR40_010489 [Pleurotus pulmonarius]|nr:hypothetical protein EYR36_010125 [Pleurotus pulmonarius]KAF4588934.1 hypothetical protein EYR40_010489 [Pleurotus pulmonarius]
MATQKQGTLTIAGTGIASIKHITLETLSYIEQADKIHYAVVDPATQAFVLEKSKNPQECFDLTDYYDNDKPRYESYVQMSEVIMKDVRQGYDVLALFYGHPGVFVFPSHRAIAIAREEGYSAKMLPGVSAEDYMFSDIGFDPANPGCTSQEATALLVSGRSLDPLVHNIIWQVGGVGVETMIFNNRKFHLLIDRLERDFGPDQVVIHYIGAVLPQSPTVRDEYTVADLRKEEIVKLISASSTFYIPPRRLPQLDPEMMRELRGTGVESPLEQAIVAMHCYPRLKWVNDESPSPPAYGPFEKNAVDNLTTHTIPPRQLFLRSSEAMNQFMKDLALKPDLRERYKEDPASVVNVIDGLTPEEKFALSLRHPSPVYRVMRATREGIQTREGLAVEELAETVNQDATIPIICVFGVLVIVVTY